MNINFQTTRFAIRIYPVLVILHLVTLFLLVGLGFYVFVADPRRRAHQTFAAFISFLALWTVKDVIFWDFYPVDPTAAGWIAASFIIALMMQFAMLVFAWVFPENSRTPRRKAAIVFAPAAVFIPAAALGLLEKQAGFVDGRLAIDFTPLAYAFVVYVYVIFGYAASILVRKYVAYRGTQAGSQVGAILLAVGITGVLKTLVNIILPLVGVYELLPFSSLFVLPGVLIYAYAIFNFRLFSLQSALVQFRLFPVAYKIAISIAAVAIASFVVLQVPIVWWAFHNGMDAEGWRRYLVFSIISALVPNLLLVLLVLRTISRPLRRITLAAVAVTKGAYGTEVEDLRPTNDEIGLLADSFNEMSRKMAADIEQLRTLNEQLVRTEKLAAIGTLAAGVAHEVNNPLAAISSLVQMMRKDHALPAEAVENLELISEQIERIRRVTADMTEFARPHPAAKRVVDLNDAIERAHRLANFDERFQRLDVRLRLDRRSPKVFGDPDQLQQVFLNILLNARDAMPNGGDLRITSVDGGGTVTVSVADSGSGIDAEAAAHVFDPFFTTKPAGMGTGLGLAVCYGIVTAHDGEIRVIPNEPKGTAVEICLPTAA